MRSFHHSLDPLFHPASVAVVGASVTGKAADHGTDGGWTTPGALADEVHDTNVAVDAKEATIDTNVGAIDAGGME